MIKKAASFLWALFVITALVLGQGEPVLAGNTAEKAANTSSDLSLSTPVTDQTENSAKPLYAPPNPVKACALGVVGVLVTAPLPPGYPNPAAGAPYYGLDTLGTMQDPGPTGAGADTHLAGDPLIWVMLILNTTGVASPSGCGSAETLTNVQAAVTIEGVDIPIPLNFPTTSGELAPGELGWAEVNYNIPSNVDAQLNIITWATANDSSGSGNPYDTSDRNTDAINMAGPGFEILSFTATPTQASPGDLVDFTIIIQNTRAVPITGISVTADDPGNLGSVAFAATCTDYPFSGSGNWKPVGGGAAISSLAPNAQAQCVIADVEIPTSPVPETYRIGGDVTATDGNPALDLTKPAVSDEVTINNAAIAVTKRVTQIQRGGQIIYTGPPAPMPPAAAGDLITYTITVTNTGDVPLNGLEIADSLGGFLIPSTTTLGIDPPDDEVVVTFTHIVSPASQDPLVNQVTVSAVSTIVPFNTVDAEASALVDILDSALEVNLIVEDPVTGLPITSVAAPYQVRYRLVLHNAGATQIDSLSYVPVGIPLQTVGTPPAITPSFLAPGGTLEFTWLYDVVVGDSDPLISTVRVRGVVEGTKVIYGQDQASLDLATPGLSIAVAVLDPPTTTVLRGAEVIYEITVTNTDSVNSLCNVVVNQYLRDPDTGLETPLILDVPMAWPDAGQPHRLDPTEFATGVTTYLVTGADKDPLDMIFEVTSDSNCSAPLPEPLTDRTTVTLDISDAQINAELVANLGADGVAEVGEAIQFNFVAQNVGAVTLENLSATWCILHRANEDPPICGLPFDPGFDLNPTSIGSFEDTSGRFTYTIEQPPDADAAPFIAEVLMIGTDSQGNEVSIRTSVVVPIATADVLLELAAPPEAVIGDTIPIGFTLTNVSGVTLSNVHLYNLLVPDAGDPYGFEEVAFFSTILGVAGQNVVSGTFDYTILPGVGIRNGVLTIVVRVTGTTATGAPVIATGTVEVDIIDMVEVIKSGDPAAVAGEAVDFTITVINHSLSQTLTITEYDDPVLEQYGVPVTSGGFATWSGSPGVLGPGEFVTGTFSIPKPPGVDPAPSPLVNVATVTGTRSSDGAIVWGSDDWEVDIACPVNFHFQVTNLDNQPDDVLGEWLRWQLSFTNVSLDTITFGGITESLYWEGAVPGAQITWPGPANQLGPGQTAVLIFPPGNPYFDKQITNEFYASDPAVMPDTMTASFSETGGVSTCAELFEYPIYAPVGILKVPDKSVAFPGETVTYTITLYNVTEADDGIYSLYYVTVYDSMFPSPILFPYDGVTPAVSGFMGPGEVVQTTLSRVIQESDPDELTNTARAEYPDPADSTVTLMVESEALVYTRNPLFLTKTPSTQLAVAGTTITYDYTITNISPYPVFGITMTDDKLGDLVPGRTGGEINLDPGESYTGSALIGVPYNIPLDALDPLTNTATAIGTILGREVPSSITVSVDLQDTEVQITKYARYDVAGSPDMTPAGIIPETPDPEGTPSVDSGTIVHYCFLVENTNPGTSTYVDDIVMQDTMFPGAVQTAFQDAVVTQLGHPAGEEDRLYGQEIVDFCLAGTALSAALGDPVTNVVSIDGLTSGGIPLYTEDELSIDILGTDLLITKIPSPPLAFVGDDVTYTITLYNNNVSLPIVNITATDTRAGGGTTPIPLAAFTWPDPGNPGTLLPGESATYTYTYTVQLTDPDPLENVAATAGLLDETSLGVPPDEWTPVSDSTRAVVAVTASQLLVNKNANPTVVLASPDGCEVKTGIGDDPLVPACRMVQYTISVTNVGSIPVQDVTIVDTHFDAETGAVVQTTFSGADLTDDDLDPLQTGFLVYSLPVPTVSQLAANPDLDPFINTAEVSGSILEDGVPGTVTTTANAAVDILVPNIRIVKSPATLAAAPGQTVTYNIVILNTGGPAETLTGLVFRDLYYTMDAVPVEVVVENINLDTVCLVPVNCPFVYGAEPDGTNPKEGTPYDPVQGLASGERLYGTVTIQIPADWPGNEFTNVAEITGVAAPLSTAVIDRSSATIDIRPEGIQVEKLASVSSAAIGDTVQYTVRVTNIGATSLDRVVIADNAMDGDPDKSITVENGFPDSPDAQIPGDDSETLDPNEVYEMVYTHVLVPTDDDPYVNRVTVTGLSSIGAVVNVAQATVDVEAAVLLVTKSVCAGDDINTGDGDASTPLDPCNTYVVIGDASPDVVTYYLHFVNPSAVPVTNIVVTDTVGTVGPITWPYTDGLNTGLNANDGVAGSGDDELWWMYTYTVQPGDPDPLVNVATVEGTAITGPVQVMASAELALVTGELLLTKDAVDQALVGQTITYTLTLENLSDSASIFDVTVVDPLSPSGTGAICTVAELLPLATDTCTFDYTITVADPSPLVNTATATGLQGLLTVIDNASHTVQILTGDLLVTKTADTTVAAIGQDVTYTYRVENVGTSDILNLVVQDTDPNVVFSSPWPAALAPGEFAVRTWTKTFAATDPDPYTNTVLATGQVLGQPVSAQATETVYIAFGDLVVTNVPDATFVLAGQPVTFTYTITNLGTFDITSLTASDTQCGDLSAQLPSTTLAPGATYTVYCTVASAALPGPIVSTVYASGYAGGVTPVSDSATSEVAVTSGGLVVTKTPDQTVVNPGDIITYTVEVMNVGTATLTNFVVDDPMIPGLAPVPPVTLLPGQSFIMTGTYTVPLVSPPASVSNVVTVTATDLAETTTFEDSDSATVAVLENPDAVLSLTKEVIPQRARPGDTVTYTFTIRNIGTDPVGDILLSDPMLADAVPPQTDGNVFLPGLEPGGVITLSYQWTIPADTTQTSIVNTAYVYVILVGEVEDTATATLLIELLDLTKTADPTTAAPGDTITYTFTIENLSTSQITNVNLNDPVVDANGTWNDPHTGLTIAGLATTTITADVTIPLAYAGLTWDNTAIVTVNAEQVDEASASVYLAANALTLTKDVDVTVASPGDTLTYTFTIENVSAGPVSLVTVDDPVVDDPLNNGVWNDPHTDITVPVGTTIITATVVIPASYVGATFDNTAVLTIDSGQVDQASTSVDIVITDLNLLKVANVAYASPGDTITYTFTIQNNSEPPAAVPNVELNDPLIDPVNPLFSGTVPTTGTVVVDTYVVPDPYVNPTVDNTAILEVDGVQVDQASESVIILENALTLTKVGTPDPVDLGGTITYTFTIENTSGGPISLVTITDPVVDDPLNNGVWVDPHTNITVPVGTTTITATVVVPLTWVPATFPNTAVLSVDGVDVVEASESITIQVPPLSLTKVADVAFASPGDTITYTFTITNNTGADVLLVTLNDPLIDAVNPLFSGTVPSTGTVVIDTYVVPDPYALPTVDNTATVSIDGVPEAAASESVTIAEPGLFVLIDRIYQLVPNAVDPLNPIQVLDPLPFQTGEPVYLVFTLSNTGTETINNLAYQVRGDGALLACQRITPTTMPTSLAASASVQVTCRFTPPVSLPVYFTPGGLSPIIQVTGAGQTASGPVTGVDEEGIELVDLRLGVDLQFALPVGVTPGTNVTAQVIITNLGASRIGCTAAEDPVLNDTSLCHLAIATDDAGIFWTWLQAEAVADGLANKVLLPEDGDPLTQTHRIVLGPVTFPTFPLKPYTVVTRGGYYSPALAASGFMDNYTAFADDMEDFRGEITVVAVANPNPPVFDESVTYTVTVTNVGQFTVSALTATYQINPVIAARIPQDGIMLAGDSTAPALQTSGTLTLAATTLAPGASTTGTLTKVEDQTGTYLFSVTAVGTALVAGDTTARTDLELTPTGAPVLDPNATEPIIEKTPNVTQVQPGDTLIWTITVRNGGTSTWQNVVVQENVPDVLIINSVVTSQGTSVTQGQVVTVNTGIMNPGDVVTITINTTVSPDAPVPSVIANSVCTTREGGSQTCETTTVNIGAGVDTLPSTGVADR